MNAKDYFIMQFILRQRFQDFRETTYLLQFTILTMTMGVSPGELSEELVTQEKRKKGWRMNCDVGEATEELENEL